MELGIGLNSVTKYASIFLNFAKIHYVCWECSVQGELSILSSERCRYLSCSYSLDNALYRGNSPYMGETYSDFENKVIKEFYYV